MLFFDYSRLDMWHVITQVQPEMVFFPNIIESSREKTSYYSFSSLVRAVTMLQS